ncbi:MAG: 50S ribosomal protein L3 [Patescibacteria group bacterium]
MNTLFGKKIGMTEVKDKFSKLVGVSVIFIDPNVVVDEKTIEKEGYSSLVVAFGDRKKIKNTTAGVLKKAGLEKKPEFLKEIRLDKNKNFLDKKIGEKISVSEIFQEGDKVKVSGVTKGKGFQGVVKRFGFAGGPKTHGSNFHRHGGSFGMREWPGEIAKGKKMPGRMGGVKVTIKNLEVVGIDGDYLILKGSVPGPAGSIVKITKGK